MADIKQAAARNHNKMANVFNETLMQINQALTPLAPAGVSGLQFIAVFLLIYGLIFILLQMANFPRGAKEGEYRGIRMVIALVAAYFTANTALSTIMISQVFPNLGMATVAILAFLLVVAFLVPEGLDKLPLRGLTVIIIIGAIIWASWQSTAMQLQLANIMLPDLSGIDWGLIIFAVIFIVLIVLITGVKVGGGKKKWEDIFWFPASPEAWRKGQ